MGGRGRSRGKPMSFDIERLGFGRGDELPAPTAEPPPLYPILKFKPVPLLSGEEQDYILALKQEFRNTCRESGYFIPPVTVKKDIERYSDKYQQLPAADQVIWDERNFPKELFQEPARAKRKKNLIKVKPNIVKRKDAGDVKDKFNELEEKEKTETDDKEKEKEDDEEEVEDEIYDEDDLEEGTDYATNYFDNGEGYLDEEDDNLDDGTEYT